MYSIWTGDRKVYSIFNPVLRALTFFWVCLRQHWTITSSKLNYAGHLESTPDEFFQQYYNKCKESSLLSAIVIFSVRWEHLYPNNRCRCEIYSWISGGITRFYGKRPNCWGCVWQNTSIGDWTHCVVPDFWLRYRALVPKGIINKYTVMWAQSQFLMTGGSCGGVATRRTRGKAACWGTLKVNFSRFLHSPNDILSIAVIKIWATCEVHRAQRLSDNT